MSQNHFYTKIRDEDFDEYFSITQVLDQEFIDTFHNQIDQQCEHYSNKQIYKNFFCRIYFQQKTCIQLNLLNYGLKNKFFNYQDQNITDIILKLYQHFKIQNHPHNQLNLKNIIVQFKNNIESSIVNNDIDKIYFINYQPVQDQTKISTDQKNIRKIILKLSKYYQQSINFQNLKLQQIINNIERNMNNPQNIFSTIYQWANIGLTKLFNQSSSQIDFKSLKQQNKQFKIKNLAMIEPFHPYEKLYYEWINIIYQRNNEKSYQKGFKNYIKQQVRKNNLLQQQKQIIDTGIKSEFKSLKRLCNPLVIKKQYVILKQKIKQSYQNQIQFDYHNSFLDTYRQFLLAIYIQVNLLIQENKQIKDIDVKGILKDILVKQFEKQLDQFLQSLSKKII